MLVSLFGGTFSVGPRHKEGGGSVRSLLSPSSSERGSHMANYSKRRLGDTIEGYGANRHRDAAALRRPDAGRFRRGLLERTHIPTELRTTTFRIRVLRSWRRSPTPRPDLRRPAAGHPQELAVTSILGRRAESQLECPIHRNNFYASDIDKPTWRTPCNFTHSG